MSLPPPPALLLLLLSLLLSPAEAQQSYVNNKQLDCNQNFTNTLGFVCNGADASCPSFLTFRSTTTYNSPATIAYLLAADASQIADANNISDVHQLPLDTLLIVPINCSCSQQYYQHNASYIIKEQGETYLSMANNTYQALTTCQAMEAQNPYNARHLFRDMRLAVPLLCACPTRNQKAAGFEYLLTYLVRQGETYDSIATTFTGAGADVESILNANELSRNDTVYYFTPILVPLKIKPTKQNIYATASPPDFSPPAPPTTPSTPSTGSDSNRGIFIGVGVGASVLILFSSIFAAWFFCYRRRRKHDSSPQPPELAEESGEAAKTFSSALSKSIESAIETLTVYKFEELEKATNSFAESNRISESFVYRASFNSDEAVVKIMKGDVSREIDALRQINHSRILRLSGFCVHQGLTYLVSEYAENGPLSDWLRPGLQVKKKDSSQLDWKQRFQIAYDVADALNYLHNFTNPSYIHKNLSSSSILLDSTMRAKLTNFTLARTMDSDDQTMVTRHVVGTYGYMAPEYIEGGLVTPKLDVYALGVVILELLSGGGKGDQVVLSTTIQEVLGKENVREKLRDFIDPCLGDEYPSELAYSAAQLASCCISDQPAARPAMSEVFVALSKLLTASLEWDPPHDTSLSFSS